MEKRQLVQRIHLTLRGLNGGMGRWDLVKRGLEKMDMAELREFNQLMLSASSNQNSRVRNAEQPWRTGRFF